MHALRACFPGEWTASAVCVSKICFTGLAFSVSAGISLAGSELKITLDVNFCKDHRNKIEVPDPLAVEDLISSKLNNKRKFARLITQYRDIFFPIFRKARPSFFRVLQRMIKVFNITTLKYGKYDITNEKINKNNKRLIDRAR